MGMYIKHATVFFVWVVSVMTHTFCVHTSMGQRVDKWVTVFTHGGGAHPVYLSVSDIFKIVNDDVEKPSVYKKTTQLLRKDPYFFYIQPQTYKGLYQVWPHDEVGAKHGAHIFAKMMATMYEVAGFPPSDFYAFGWSGLLSITARRKAAMLFYDALVQLSQKLRNQGYNPRIRLIAYSHGGNMALHLAEVARARKVKPFIIDELILVATPIHANTEPYITSRLFKEIFLFYSLGDNIQIDFLTSPNFSFASRKFIGKSGTKVPKNVTQVQVSFYRTHIHVKGKDGTTKSIAKRETIHPNHTEMFFFGWAPEWYRRYFPIRPFSVALLIPIFLRNIREHSLEGEKLRFRIYPETGYTGIKIQNRKTHLRVPFIEPNKFLALRQELHGYSAYTRMPHRQYRMRMIERREHAKEMLKNVHATKRQARRKWRAQSKQHVGPACDITLWQ
jgi:hypothetical protein